MRFIGKRAFATTVAIIGGIQSASTYRSKTINFLHTKW